MIYNTPKIIALGSVRDFTLAAMDDFNKVGSKADVNSAAIAALTGVTIVGSLVPIG